MISYWRLTLLDTIPSLFCKAFSCKAANTYTVSYHYLIVLSVVVALGRELVLRRLKRKWKECLGCMWWKKSLGSNFWLFGLA